MTIFHEFDLIGNMISQNYLIYGLGKSGTASFELLKVLGVPDERIICFDDQSLTPNLKLQIQSISPGTLILSPGVPLASVQVQEFLRSGWTLGSEISLASTHLKNEKIIGITGSVGKSTVTSLVGLAVLQNDPNAFVGGNLGTPFSQYIIDVLAGRQRARWIVLELSSYQLENCDGLHLDYSAITYLSANHLERYSSLDHYYLIKCSIGKITKEICFVNSDCVDLAAYQNRISGNVQSSSISGNDPNFIRSSSLIGKHNAENLALAFTIGTGIGLSKQCLNAMLAFRGLPHRMESLESRQGIHFVNDSKATAIESVLVAICAVLEKSGSGKIYVLVGGRDKKLPWEKLSEIKQHQFFSKCHFYFFGECRQTAHSKSTLIGEVFLTLGDALDAVHLKLKQDDVLLLSPGGTSLDEFKNFEDRGQFFKNFVQKKFPL